MTFVNFANHLPHKVREITHINASLFDLPIIIAMEEEIRPPFGRAKKEKRF